MAPLTFDTREVDDIKARVGGAFDAAQRTSTVFVYPADMGVVENARLVASLAAWAALRRADFALYIDSVVLVGSPKQTQAAAYALRRFLPADCALSQTSLGRYAAGCMGGAK